jgi:hypothetical protein
MLQKPVPQTVPFMGALDQPRDVSNHKGPVIIQGNHTQVRHQRRKGIIRDLGFRGADARYQSRFAGVGKADQSDVRDELQIQGDFQDLAGAPRFRATGGLIGGGGKMRITAPPFPSYCNPQPFARHSKILELHIFGFLEHLGSRRNQDGNVLSVSAMTTGTLPMPAPAGFENPPVPEVQKRVDPLRALQVDVASPAPIAAARPATRDKLFTPEGKAAVATVARTHCDCGLINKHDMGCGLHCPDAGGGKTKRTPFGVLTVCLGDCKQYGWLWLRLDMNETP